MGEPIDPASIHPVELTDVLDLTMSGCMLPAAAYCDERVLGWERSNLFAGAWVCAGRSVELDTPGARVAVAVADDQVVLVQVSFNNYDRAPFLLVEDEMLAFYDALRAFETIANDRSMQWRHVLAPGEALLFDNWRVLHGRAAYTGHRRLCGGYVNREDVESRRRVSASALTPSARSAG